MMLAIYNIEKPVIAAVRGPAAGVGWSLALACDFIVAAEDARFGGGFVKVGLVPDGGSIFFLSRLLGSGRAKQIGRASCRERVWPYVSIYVVPVHLKKKNKRNTN